MTLSASMHQLRLSDDAMACTCFAKSSGITLCCEADCRMFRRPHASGSIQSCKGRSSSQVCGWAGNVSMVPLKLQTQSCCVQLAQALSQCLIFGNMSIAMLQKAFGGDHLALLGQASVVELGQHIFVLTLNHLKASTSSSTVIKMFEKSQVCEHAALSFSCSLEKVCGRRRCHEYEFGVLWQWR